VARDEIEDIAALLGDVQRALVELAAQHIETILPGFTHLQVAQPVSFAHHLLAYVEMFALTASGWAGALAHNRPLGAAARRNELPLDREAVAKALRMEGVCLQQHRRGERPRLRDRVHRRGEPGDAARRA
jgi:argininosuccinate lyase